ncbi:MAG: AMP-binding protein [Acidimicrobiales bacterium]
MTLLRTSHWLPVDDEAVLPTTIASILRDAAARAPDAVALVEGIADASKRRRLTYAQLLDCAQRSAGKLAGRFDEDERICCVSASTPDALVLSYAAAFAGLVLVPVNPSLRPAEMSYLFSQSGASGVFTGGEWRGSDLGGVTAAAATDVPSVREVIDLRQVVPITPGRGESCDVSELREPEPDDIAQIVYTSGTTGLPKGARLTHRGMTNAARFGGIRFGIEPGDVYVDTMPLHHVGGQVVAFQICQALATAVLVTAFDAGVVLELVESEHATITVGVPTMLLSLIEHPDFNWRDLSSLRSVSSGGAVVPPELVRHIEASLQVRSTICFGQTESCGFISQTHDGDSAEDKAETLGQPLPRVEARVVSVTDGSVVDCGDVGELEVRSPFVMSGYHQMDVATTEALDPEGWLRTGDLVTMDERGFLRIAGRSKDMIVSGGENIFPVEIETVLSSHPGVAMAAVLGVPDHMWGEKVVAFVRPVPGGSLDTEQLGRYVRERLASFKVPKQIYVTDDFPLTASGKIQKFILRQRIVGEGHMQ